MKCKLVESGQTVEGRRRSAASCPGPPRGKPVQGMEVHPSEGLGVLQGAPYGRREAPLWLEGTPRRAEGPGIDSIRRTGQACKGLLCNLLQPQDNSYNHKINLQVHHCLVSPKSMQKNSHHPPFTGGEIEVQGDLDFLQLKGLDPDDTSQPPFPDSVLVLLHLPHAFHFQSTFNPLILPPRGSSGFY